MRTFALLCFVFTCTVFSAQNLQISRHYAGNAKNVPVHIYNHHASHFYVLRYNRSIHDMIIERRSKPGAELQRIFPLQLDSVNAKWFDYENIDYLLFEKHNQLHFVFVKELNNQSTVYIKTLDSLGKLSGFKAISSASAEPGKAAVKIEIERTENNNVLIKQRYTYVNETAKAIVSCYNPFSKTFETHYQLPLENRFTGYSTAFTTGENGSLYYLQVHSRIASFTKQYTAQGSIEVPQFITDSIAITKVNAQRKLWHCTLPFKNLYNQFDVHILPMANKLQVAFKSAVEGDSGLVYKFFAASFTADSLQFLTSNESVLNTHINQQLRYYDGSDIAAAGAKPFYTISTTRNTNFFSAVEGRRDGNYYKELLYWQYDRVENEFRYQHLIPRKVFYFQNRSPYRQLAEVAVLENDSCTNLFLLEHKANKSILPKMYFHRSFAKQTQLRTGVLVQYRIQGAVVKKRVIYENADFDWIPMRYDGWDKDFVMYLSKHKAEKWAILSDSDF